MKYQFQCVPITMCDCKALSSWAHLCVALHTCPHTSTIVQQCVCWSGACKQTRIESVVLKFQYSLELKSVVLHFQVPMKMGHTSVVQWEHQVIHLGSAIISQAIESPWLLCQSNSNHDQTQHIGNPIQSLSHIIHSRFRGQIYAHCQSLSMKLDPNIG